MAYLPDLRGVIGLGVLGSARAEPALRALLEAEQRAQIADGKDWHPYGLIVLARALWQIDRDPRWPAPIIAVLEFGLNSIHRQTAAQALCDIGDPATVRALRGALDDSEPLVRYHAGRGLLPIYGLMRKAALPPVETSHMLYRVMSKDLVRREGGKQDILAAIAGR